ncbi:hypothetical protein RB195_001992 [Necator americanus]|uniref:GOLD domain-containing protein n=1 Tax=Necator americanus TaxID=51031 RepID=A0ABR1DGW9_NECAM
MLTNTTTTIAWEHPTSPSKLKKYDVYLSGEKLFTEKPLQNRMLIDKLIPDRKNEQPFEYMFPLSEDGMLPNCGERRRKQISGGVIKMRIISWNEAKNFSRISFKLRPLENRFIVRNEEEISIESINIDLASVRTHQERLDSLNNEEKGTIQKLSQLDKYLVVFNRHLIELENSEDDVQIEWDNAYPKLENTFFVTIGIVFVLQSGLIVALREVIKKNYKKGKILLHGQKEKYASVKKLRRSTMTTSITGSSVEKSVMKAPETPSSMEKSKINSPKMTSSVEKSKMKTPESSLEKSKMNAIKTPSQLSAQSAGTSVNENESKNRTKHDDISEPYENLG